MGSPSGVPVPCASMTSTSLVVSPALARACRMTRCCEGPLGAVSPLLAPSWLIADPRTTARTGCPLALASDSRSTSRTPTPSLQPVPSADSEKARQRPSEARPPWPLSPANPAGVAMTMTPPARAIEHSPFRSAWAARCSATSDDEQAVSTVRAGPSRPSV